MQRFHGLDALRASMMLLGVFLHTACAYSSLPDIWWYKDPRTSVIMDGSLIFIHIFRMPVFFVMAGFFWALLVHRRGPREALRNRVHRIGLPLILGIAVMTPLLKPFAAYQRFAERTPDPASATVDWFLSGRWVRWVETMHLWFLLYLLVLYALALLLGGLADRLAAAPWYRRLLHHPLRALAFATLTFGALMTMQMGLLDTSNSFLPVPRIVAVYAIFFFGGWTLFRHHDLLPKLARECWGQLSWGALLGLVNVLLALNLVAARSAGHDFTRWKWGVAATGAVAVWLLVFGLMGLCCRYWNTPSERVRYLSDSAYWLYLAHPLALVPAQFLFWHVPIGWAAKLTFTLALAVPTLLVSYHFLVRPTWLGELLNGKRYGREKLG
ncbi:MAG: acyltransferase family protein, partial [Bryobacterales bacterium]|nr:acyltransferase family protein [Bryobacterales bacterium]